MPLSTKVELCDGKTITVYSPPAGKIRSLVEEKYPKPQKKVVTETTVSGGTTSMVIEDDPEYLRKMDKWETLITRETNELNSLFSLKDENPPEDFDIETEHGVLIRYTAPDWQPRTGDIGRKLDWIEWELLGNPGDVLRVEKAMLEMMGIDIGEISSIEDSFRGQVAREANRILAQPKEEAR